MANSKNLLKKNSGLTLVEIIIAFAILGILAAWAIGSLNPRAQICKATDAKRKSDLKRIQVALEDYYEDHNCYPDSLAGGESFSPYLETVPLDPDGESYLYSIPAGVTSPQSYRIYTRLCYECDPDIPKVGCGTGCGPGSSSDYNYGVCSTNVSLETGTGASFCGHPTLPANDCGYACRALDDCAFLCFPGWPADCPKWELPNCGPGCSNPDNICEDI